MSKREKRADSARNVAQATPPKAAVASIIRTPLLNDAAALARAHEAYASSTPYTHACLRGLFDEAHLAAAKGEIVQHLRAEFKETDLFKVLQVPLDLACLEQSAPAIAARMPKLLALRDAIYSEAFRDMLRRLTGCGPLAQKTDCSVNIYARGHHLLCHDDVIGTRRISYIVYLTEPGRDWSADDGGALELYAMGPPDASGVAQPEPTPAHFVLPHWNSMALFEVQPGRSYHSVGEVVGEVPRMSISGWFHRPDDEDAPMLKASLAQLKDVPSSADASTANAPFEPLPLFADDAAGSAPPDGLELLGALSAPERALLAEWLNPTYLEPESVRKIQAQFATHSCMQLRGFLRDDVAARIDELARAADLADGVGATPPERLASRLCNRHDLGVQAGWRVVGPPHMQRFLRFDAALDAADASPDRARAAAAAARAPVGGVGAALARVHESLAQSSAFQKYLLALTQLRVVGSRAAVRRFRPGLDYTVAHAAAMPPRRSAFLDATVCFVYEGERARAPSGGARGKGAEGARKRRRTALSHERAEWQSGEVGGFEAYIGAEEDTDPEVTAVYKSHAARAKPTAAAAAREGEAADPSGADGEHEEEDEGDLLNVEASNNTLNLVMRDSGTLRFVKYLSARAPGSRWDVAVEYKIHASDLEPDDGSEDSSDGEEGTSDESDDDEDEGESESESSEDEAGADDDE